MKIVTLLACLSFTMAGFSVRVDERVEFICMKRKLSTQTCHYNFRIDGAKYRYVDLGCKIKKQADVIEKARSGNIALARNWEIECPEIKSQGGADSENRVP